MQQRHPCLEGFVAKHDCHKVAGGAVVRFSLGHLEQGHGEKLQIGGRGLTGAAQDLHRFADPVWQGVAGEAGGTL